MDVRTSHTGILYATFKTIRTLHDGVIQTGQETA